MMTSPEALEGSNSSGDGGIEPTHMPLLMILWGFVQNFWWIIILLSTPAAVGSWWRQWVVMAAWPCNLWYMWWSETLSMILIRYHCTPFHVSYLQIVIVEISLQFQGYVWQSSSMYIFRAPCGPLKSDLAITFLELLLLKMGFLARSGLQLRWSCFLNVVSIWVHSSS